MVDFLIIGAGISGLALAYFLQKNNYNCLIIERDHSIYGKRQGFSLTLQSETKKILEEYGLLNEIYNYGAPVNTQIFYNQKGEILHEQENKNRFNYPLPRQDIRNLFYNQLREGTIVWNKSVTEIITTSESNEVVCSDQSRFQCKVLFACDGLHSKVSQSLPTNKILLNDLNLMNIYGLSKLDNTEFSDFFKNREVQVLDGYHRFFSKPFDDHFQMWELTYPLNHNDTDGQQIYDLLNSKQDPRHHALQKVIQVVHQWTIPELHQFIEACDVNRIIVHPLYDHIPTDDNIENLSKKKIVLIGDSIHPMSPFIGMGANQAIKDAHEFVNLLKECVDLEEMIDLYHHKMVERSRRSVIRSRENTLFYHSPDAIYKEKLYEFKKW